jgi:hypothetical protein
MSDTTTQVVPENGEGWVVMWHPGTPDYDDGTKATAEVLRAAFDETWKAKGWQIVGEYVDASVQDTPTVAPAPASPAPRSTPPAPPGGDA